MSRVADIVHSSTFRVALLYALVFGASVLVLLAFLYWSTAGYMARQADVTIDAEIEGLAEQYRREGLERLTRVIAERIARDPQGRSVYLFADRRLNALAGNLSHWPEAEPDDDGWIEFPLTSNGAKGHARARTFILASGLRLLVGRDTQELRDVQALVLGAMAWGLALMLALAIGGGFVTSRALLRRLESINATSRRIIDGELQMRVPVTARGDDFDELAANLNHMLDEIESLMASVRQVSDNVAHDLRTPLTRLRQRLETLQLASSDEAQAALVHAAMEEADQLLAAFTALLRIARLESGRAGTDLQAIDVAEVASDACELYEAVAQERGLSLRQRHAAGALVRADRDLLFQALVNLLDNALKFTPAGGTVRVESEVRDDRVLLSVSDNGPGLAPALHGKVLERFYRADESRSTPGHGLGLSLVAAVARHHGAQIALFDNAPGLTVRLEFELGKYCTSESSAGGPMDVMPRSTT